MSKKPVNQPCASQKINIFIWEMLVAEEQCFLQKNHCSSLEELQAWWGHLHIFNWWLSDTLIFILAFWKTVVVNLRSSALTRTTNVSLLFFVLSLLTLCIHRVSRVPCHQQLHLFCVLLTVSLTWLLSQPLVRVNDRDKDTISLVDAPVWFLNHCFEICQKHDE